MSAGQRRVAGRRRRTKPTPSSLQRARWKLLQKQNPSPDLASARNYFEQGRRERPNQIWPQKGLAACRLEELKAHGIWDEGGYLRLLAEVKKLTLTHAKDPSLLALLKRVQDCGAGQTRPQKNRTAKWRENPPRKTRDL